MKTITVLYFAILREQTGTPQENIQTDAATVAALFDELSARHQIALAFTDLRFACNQEFVPGDHVFASGDTLALMPPMAGG